MDTLSRQRGALSTLSQYVQLTPIRLAAPTNSARSQYTLVLFHQLAVTPPTSCVTLSALPGSPSLPTLNEQTCPVCLSSADFTQSGLGRDSKTIVCMRCRPFEISGTALAMLDGRLIEDLFARPRLSHAIRTRTSEDNPIFVSSTNLDNFVHQSLPGVEQYLKNLVHWLAAQLSDDPLGRIPNLWPEMLAGIIGAVDGDRVNRLLRYGIEQGILEFDENKDLLGLSPQGWSMIAVEKNQAMLRTMFIRTMKSMKLLSLIATSVAVVVIHITVLPIVQVDQNKTFLGPIPTSFWSAAGAITSRFCIPTGSRSGINSKPIHLRENPW